MKKIFYCFISFLIPVSLLAQSATQATANNTKKKHATFLYASWGYNTESYTRSSVQVHQPSLGNDYTLEHVNANDHRGWDSKSIFRQPVSIPQYNYRLGYIFNEEKGLGIEINFDHTKYIISDPQNINIKGKLNDVYVNNTIAFTKANGFYYYLNNGANFLLFNMVKRLHLYSTKNKCFVLDALGKAGIGPVIPHVENSFFGQANSPHFQLGGWNTGIEATLKCTFFKYIYLEYCNKLDYARYSNLKIYEGTAKQAFGTYEMILNLGVNLPIRK